MSKAAYHVPQGNPCRRCGLPAHRHRVWHPAEGCDCGAYHRPKPVRSRVYQRETRYKYIGLDGEGRGRKDHKYILLAYSDSANQTTGCISHPAGLQTVECLEFLLTLPRRNTRIFTYSFNYDLTMMLRDMPDELLYRLFRPELRQRAPQYRKLGPRPVVWGHYALNLQSTKFTIRRGDTRTTIWDIWKFFQCRFTKALEDWQISDNLEFIQRMKDSRAEFDKQSLASIKTYCLSECRNLATLGERLVAAHNKAGLPLRTFYGPGSTATIILRRAEADQARRAPIDAMKEPVARAFFGGRFENSIIGPVNKTVYSYDISSAYPYQIYQLPCLEHGKWVRTESENRFLRCKGRALVRYSLHDVKEAWAPFPFRDKGGTISFPHSIGDGWAWDKEYRQALYLFQDNIEFKEAWLLDSDCECQPFQDIAQYYIRRCELGKDTAGMPLKLGPNSVYGKLAQSVGLDPPFQCWIWAGMVTSDTRAQILELMLSHRKFRNILAIATDGIYSTELISTPYPIDSGTNHLPKPLGGWERKRIDRGMFFARPGIYFPLNPTEEDIQSIRARGVGRATLAAQWERLIDAYHKGEEIVTLDNVVRFRGAKTGISKAQSGYNRSPEYGNWITRPVKLSLNPLPKRTRYRRTQKLQLLDMSGKPSYPYSRATISPETLALRLAAIEAQEQPDGGEYETYEE